MNMKCVYTDAVLYTCIVWYGICHMVWSCAFFNKLYTPENDKLILWYSSIISKERQNLKSLLH